MSNNIVQLTDYNDNNIYPIAGAAAEGSITRTMLDEGVFVGAELSDPGNTAYVGTADIQDNAVTAPKLGIPCPVISENLSEPSSVAYVATDNIQDNAVTSDKIDYTTYGSEKVVGKLQDSTTVYEQLLIGNIPSYSTASTVVKLGHIDNVGRIIYMDGWAKRADYWTSMAQQYDNLKSAVQFAQRTGGGVQSGDITFLGDTEYAGAQFSLTIRYTKSG